MWKNTPIKDKQFMKSISKDECVTINNFDAAHRLLNCGEKPLEGKSFRDKLDLFFIDYDLIPLLVQECYLNAFQNRKEMSDLEDMANAADQIRIGD